MSNDASPVTSRTHRWRYRIAGLEIESEVRLRETDPLTDADRPRADLIVLDGRRHALPRPPATNAHNHDACRVRYVVPGVGRFLVEDGRRVVTWPDAGADDAAVSQQIAGSAIALAFMQRGTLVLHASVVEIDGMAVLVTGHSGDGKSTFAAACAAAGYGVVADDLAVLDAHRDQWAARRMPSIVRLADGAPAALPAGEGWQADGKTVRRLPADNPRESVPVAGIVCLAWDAEVALTPVAPVEAALLLIGHAYCAPVFRPPQAETALRQCAAIAGACPVWRLSRPRDRVRIPETVALLADGIRARG